MSNTNGVQHTNVEDLLASIRNSIADEAAQVGLHYAQTVSGAAGGQRRRDLRPLSEDTSDFELPAIFKPGHQQQSQIEKPKLFDRFSDALKTGAEQVERTRTVIRFEPANAGRMIEPPAAAQPVAPEPAPVRAAPEEPVRREMPTFFDTRMKRMSEPAKPQPAPVPQEPPAAQRPPQLPPAAASAAGPAGVEDAAAQLLRPILKEWLSENLPKIVEKALRSELGDDPKGPKR